MDHRTRVEDVTDIDDDSDSIDLRRRAGAGAGANAKAKPRFKTPHGGTLPLPTTTATAAAVGVPGSASNPCLNGAVGLHAVHTNINPALGVNPVFTHVNTPFQGHGQMPPYGIPGQPGFVAATTAGPYSYAIATNLAAGTDPSSTGMTFVPAVPDATNGPMVHTYIPRSDMAVAGQGPGGVGIVYVQAPHAGYATVSSPNSNPYCHHHYLQQMHSHQNWTSQPPVMPAASSSPLMCCPPSPQNYYASCHRTSDKPCFLFLP